MRGKVRSGGPRGTEEETARLHKARARDHRKHLAVLLGAAEKERILGEKRRSRSGSIAGSKRKATLDGEGSNDGRSKLHKAEQDAAAAAAAAGQKRDGFNEHTMDAVGIGAKRQRSGPTDGDDGEFFAGERSNSSNSGGTNVCTKV